MNTPGVLRSVPTGKGGGPDHDILAGCRRATAEPGARSTTATRRSFTGSWRRSACRRRSARTPARKCSSRSTAAWRTSAAKPGCRPGFTGSPPVTRRARPGAAACGRCCRACCCASRRRRPRPMRPRRPSACACSTSWSPSCRRRRSWCWCCSRSKDCQSRRSRKIAECPENTAWSRLHYARAELMAMARKRLKTTKRDDREHREGSA